MKIRHFSIEIFKTYGYDTLYSVYPFYGKILKHPAEYIPLLWYTRTPCLPLLLYTGTPCTVHSVDPAMVCWETLYNVNPC